MAQQKELIIFRFDGLLEYLIRTSDLSIDNVAWRAMLLAEGHHDYLIDAEWETTKTLCLYLCKLQDQLLSQ